MGADEPGAPAVADPPLVDALLARSHGAQVLEADLRLVPALRPPAQPARLVAVEAVPAHVGFEAADRLEAGAAVELDRPARLLVAVQLVYRRAGPRMTVEGFAATGAEIGIGVHALEHDLEIARGKLEIDVELAEEVMRHVDVLQPLVEGADDAGSDRARAAERWTILMNGIRSR